jgi:AraC-like DNA-binding protein
VKDKQLNITYKFKDRKVKELLTYDEMSLNDIADEMNYSSVSHLSKQFKGD